MKVYSVVMQWTDNSMGIPKYPKRVYAQYTDFKDAKKLRNRLRALGEKGTEYYIREDEIDAAVFGIPIIAGTELDALIQSSQK